MHGAAGQAGPSGIADEFVRHAPYNDGFPGPGAVSLRGSLRLPVCMFAGYVVGSLPLSLLLQDGLTSTVVIGLALCLLAPGFFGYQALRECAVVGPMGIDVGRWGVGWGRIGRVDGTVVYFDPPLDLPRSAYIRSSVSRQDLRLRREEFHEAVRRFRPDLVT